MSVLGLRFPHSVRIHGGLLAVKHASLGIILEPLPLNMESLPTGHPHQTEKSDRHGIKKVTCPSHAPPRQTTRRRLRVASPIPRTVKLPPSFVDQNGFGSRPAGRPDATREITFVGEVWQPDRRT